jgi:hypothetical protein
MSRRSSGTDRQHAGVRRPLPLDALIEKEPEDRGGAGWWREGLALAGLRSRLPIDALGVGALTVAALPGCYTEARPDEGIEVRAFDLQQRAGWDVGATGRLAYADACAMDVDGNPAWRDALAELPMRLAPAQPALLPYYVPTLFQSVTATNGLAREVRPTCSTEQTQAFERGRALRALFEQAAAGAGGAFPTDTAIVVDAPGPEAVAVAAALAERFEPVWTFDNWPHPAGVVPAHETLGAALYFTPALERARDKRPAGAPPVFVLDADRLAPYGDDGDRFDNRYLARLPSADGFARLGVRHVLYVTGGARAEADDLNEDFVALGIAGIDVKLLALDDFRQRGVSSSASLANASEERGERSVSSSAPLANASEEYGDPQAAAPPDDEWAAEEPTPDEVTADPDADSGVDLSLSFYFGGSPWAQSCFWDYYDWYRPPHRRTALVPPPPRGTAHGWRYVAHSRATPYPGGLYSTYTALPRAGGARLGHVFLSPSGHAPHYAPAPASRGSFSGFFAGRSGSLGRFHGGYSS